MNTLVDLILANERWLMVRILHYAKQQGYVKYTSTLVEAWRISIVRLSETIVTAIQRDPHPPEMAPDDDFSSHPVAAVGVEDGLRHRGRGLTLGMYLSLLKYYRQCYVDLIQQQGYPIEEERSYRLFVARCFDLVELGVATGWYASESERLAELQRTNRYLANEKNKYLTIFESLHDPVILLDSEEQINNMNHAAAALFGRAGNPGNLYYGPQTQPSMPAWLPDSLDRLAGDNSVEFEATLETLVGLRDYQVKLERMRDVSEKFMGVVALLTDLTERKQAERRLIQAHRELSTLYDVTAIANLPMPLDAVLEQVLGRVLETIQGQRGEIHLLDPESGELQSAAVIRSAGYEVISVNGKALAAWVVAHNMPLVIANMAEDDRVPPGVRPDHTFVGVPMRAGGRLHGVLTIFRPAGECFEQAETSLLSSVADGVGLAVENNRCSRRSVVMAERERLARELHDSVTQSLYSLSLFGEWTASLLQNGDSQLAGEKVTRMGEIARQALKEMRLMVYELRSPELAAAGLYRVLENRLAAVEERSGVETSLHFAVTWPLSTQIEAELLAIAQEGLNNALKHARAHAVTVSIEGDAETLRLTVCDDGVGFVYADALSAGGMGLHSMCTRAERLGGSFWIDSTPGAGSSVHVHLALSTEKANGYGH
ncbi:GAF domain-containing protein [bacterium]|nr:GAF domain-containing protein [bacterium]